MKTTQNTIKNARAEIITHIITLMRKIDAYFETGDKQLMTNPEEDVVVDFMDCVYAPSILIEVDNSYLDVEETCTEVRTLDFIATRGDHDFYVGDSANSEVKAEDISTDDLIEIAEVLEETYDDME